MVDHKPLVVNLEHREVVSLQVILRHYLVQFDAETIRQARPGSCLKSAERLFNRLDNHSHGSFSDHDLNRPYCWEGK